MQQHLAQALKRKGVSNLSPREDALYQEIEGVLKDLGIQCYCQVQLPGSYFAVDMLLVLTGDLNATLGVSGALAGPQNHLGRSDVRMARHMSRDSYLPDMRILEVLPSSVVSNPGCHDVSPKGYHGGRIAHFRRMGYEVLVLPTESWEALRNSGPGLQSKYMASKLGLNKKTTYHIRDDQILAA
jgi:hypothetical protein